MSDRLLEALQVSKLFAGMSDAAASECARQFTLIRADKHRQLFCQGDAGGHIYSVLRGFVHIGQLTEDGDDFTVRIVGSGDVFGDEALFGNAVRSRTATALGDCIVAVCRAEVLKSLCMQHPLLGLNIAQSLEERHDRALDRIRRMALSCARDHLFALLQDLASKCGVAEPGGTRIDVILTQAQLASLIGTSRETVSYELRELAREGYVLRRGRKIVIASSRFQAA